MAAVTNPRRPMPADPQALSLPPSPPPPPTPYASYPLLPQCHLWFMHECTHKRIRDSGWPCRVLCATKQGTMIQAYCQILCAAKLGTIIRFILSRVHLTIHNPKGVYAYTSKPALPSARTLALHCGFVSLVKILSYLPVFFYFQF